MAVVDSSDDAIWRWVIRHYRYDPARRQRRNAEVAAYDNEFEYQSELARYGEKVRGEIPDGTRSDREWVSGVALEPGYLAAQAHGHTVRRAIEHGVNPARLLTSDTLPADMAVFSFREDDAGPASAVDRKSTGEC